MDIFGVFGIRGRAKEVHHLDDAFQALGLHPARVPDSVKLAAVKLLKEAEGGKLRDAVKSCMDAALLLAYCMLGSDSFMEANGGAKTDAAKYRLRLSTRDGTCLDAKLAMLTLFADTIHPAGVQEFDLEVEI